MMLQANSELRAELRQKNIPIWLVAKHIGIHEKTLIGWLREELDGERKERVLEAAAKIERGAK